MTKTTFSLVIYCLVSLLPIDTLAQGSPPRCMRDILAGFFDATTVTQAMSLYQIKQGQWAPVNNSLKKIGPKIYRLVQQKAKKIRPNPLRRPYNPEATLLLMKQTLFEVFKQVMHEYYIEDQGRIEKMFQYIQSKKIGSIEGCFNVPLSDPYLEDEQEEPEQ